MYAANRVSGPGRRIFFITYAPSSALFPQPKQMMIGRAIRPHNGLSPSSTAVIAAAAATDTTDSSRAFVDAPRKSHDDDDNTSSSIMR